MCSSPLYSASAALVLEATETITYPSTHASALDCTNLGTVSDEPPWDPFELATGSNHRDEEA